MGDRIRKMGPFSYYFAYMSQPKHQLETFKAWAGKSSDISYYLNSHHIDYHEWCMHGKARPVRVTAHCSTGVANRKLAPVETEDTITIIVDWKNFEDGSIGHGVYTSSWVAAKSDVHSQQRWFYMGQEGEVTVDQAPRGYTVAQDGAAFASPNPLFWKPTPSDGVHRSAHLWLSLIRGIRGRCERGELWEEEGFGFRWDVANHLHNSWYNSHS